MTTYYPPLGFHFEVRFNNFKDEIHFQSVTGLNVELETEQIAEGGENRFKHTLPTRAKYQNLVLKRGMLIDSKLIAWCRNTVENLDIQPTDLTITLLNNEHKPLVTWKVTHAWPIKWTVDDLNAETGKIVIETIELVYDFFSIE